MTFSCISEAGRSERSGCSQGLPAVSGMWHEEDAIRSAVVELARFNTLYPPDGGAARGEDKGGAEEEEARAGVAHRGRRG